MEEDTFKDIVFPNSGASALILALFSLLMTAIFIPIYLSALEYESNVNPQSTLLTRLQTASLKIYICWTPIAMVDIVRFSTGIQINSGICMAYIYAEYLLFQILLVIFVLETVVHYIFIKRVSFLLVVKEDLIMTILWRGATTVGLGSTFVKFHGLIKLPMTYHMCTGTLLPEIYWSPFTEKCDEDNNGLENVTTMVYTLIFLLFGSAVVFETVKSRAWARRRIDPGFNIQPRRLRIFIDNKSFILKTIYAICTSILYFKYNQYGPKELSSYPGYLIVYTYHFVSLQMFVIFAGLLFLSGHESWKNHLKRRVKQIFGQEDLVVINQ